ncbi:MAG: hypothetical protein MUE85_10270 [Microscillaceae bacterium]|jgi:hypothetical protein|nr:hypothetical protein [Microscillaceae bacterium]
MKQIGIVLIISLLTACGEKKASPALQKAAEIHKQAMAIHQKIMPQIDEFEKFLPKLQAALDTLRPNNHQDLIGQNQNLQAEIKQTQKAMQEWMKNVVEVPGSEAHDHHHHAGESHHHAPTPQVTEEEMLEIQTEILQNIQKIAQTSQTLQTKLKNYK